MTFLPVLFFGWGDVALPIVFRNWENIGTRLSFQRSLELRALALLAIGLALAEDLSLKSGRKRDQTVTDTLSPAIIYCGLPTGFPQA
ncbi:hypothetical protein HJC23_009638 [Cyclotella cryptica]|uniref:Uncharacterized protein n=1 Tax=Cyclotella cryptica TaxID=29204 RepID=A0ABD3PVL8_9STRA